MLVFTQYLFQFAIKNIMMKKMQPNVTLFKGTPAPYAHQIYQLTC